MATFKRSHVLSCDLDFRLRQQHCRCSIVITNITVVKAKKYFAPLPMIVTELPFGSSYALQKRPRRTAVDFQYFLLWLIQIRTTAIPTITIAKHPNIVHEKLQNRLSMTIDRLTIAKHLGQTGTHVQIVCGNVQHIKHRFRISIDRIGNVSTPRQFPNDIVARHNLPGRHHVLVQVVFQRCVLIVCLVIVFLFQQFGQHMLTMAVRTVVTDVVSDESFGDSNFVFQEIRCLLQYPLTMTPRMVVAGIFLRTSFA